MSTLAAQAELYKEGARVLRRSEPPAIWLLLRADHFTALLTREQLQATPVADVSSSQVGIFDWMT